MKQFASEQGPGATVPVELFQDRGGGPGGDFRRLPHCHF